MLQEESGSCGSGPGAVLSFDLANGRGRRIAAETLAAVEWAVLGADFARIVQAGQVRFP